jgi:hypothetical protein
MIPEDLVALDSRRVSFSGTSARISIPQAQDLGLVGNSDGLEASVSVRQTDDEIIVEARIPLDDD